MILHIMDRPCRRRFRHFSAPPSPRHVKKTCILTFSQQLFLSIPSSWCPSIISSFILHNHQDNRRWYCKGWNNCLCAALLCILQKAASICPTVFLRIEADVTPPTAFCLMILLEHTFNHFSTPNSLTARCSSSTLGSVSERLKCVQ